MNILLDTNVLVSGLLTPFGASGETVRLVSSDTLVLLYDARILLEYGEVLRRPKFQFKPQHVETLLDTIQRQGRAISASPLKGRLPDEGDEPFLEIAIAGRADCLVTGNKKHFPKRCREGIPVYSPAEFIEFYRSNMP